MIKKKNLLIYSEKVEEEYLVIDEVCKIFLSFMVENPSNYQRILIETTTKINKYLSRTTTCTKVLPIDSAKYTK